MRLTSVTHAGLTWRYSRDAAGRLVAETDYNGATTRYSYDPAGQLICRVNAAGQQVRCSYDELGQLTGRAADGVITSFGYDAAGLLVLARNPGAEVRLSRDPLGRVITETCDDRAVVSEYDRAGTGQLPDPVAAGGWGGHEVTGLLPGRWPPAGEDQWIWSVITRQPGGWPAWLAAGGIGTPACAPPWPW